MKGDTGRVETVIIAVSSRAFCSKEQKRWKRKERISGGGPEISTLFARESYTYAHQKIGLLRVRSPPPLSVRPVNVRQGGRLTMCSRRSTVMKDALILGRDCSLTLADSKWNHLLEILEKEQNYEIKLK